MNRFRIIETKPGLVVSMSEFIVVGEIVYYYGELIEYSGCIITDLKQLDGMWGLLIWFPETQN